MPLEVVPLTEQYWQRVVSHCLDEIRAGRTPNPDILCNSRSAALCRQCMPVMASWLPYVLARAVMRW